MPYGNDGFDIYNSNRKKFIKSDAASFDDINQAIDFFELQREQGPVMPKEKLELEIDNYLKHHNIGCLATVGIDGTIRNTCMRFNYRGGLIWMLSEGGLKFANIIQNPRGSITIFSLGDKNTDEISHFTAEGVIKILRPHSENYDRFIKIYDLEVLYELKHPVFVLYMKPKFVEIFDSGLEKQGYNSRQRLYLLDDDFVK